MLKASRREHRMRAGAVLPACRIALVGALTLALVLPGVGILTGSAASAAAVVSAGPPYRIPPKPTVIRPTAAEASRRNLTSLIRSSGAWVFNWATNCVR